MVCEIVKRPMSMTIVSDICLLGSNVPSSTGHFIGRDPAICAVVLLTGCWGAGGNVRTHEHVCLLLFLVTHLGLGRIDLELGLTDDYWMGQNVTELRSRIRPKDVVIVCEKSSELVHAA